jgi:hypothetical protein
MAKNLLRQLPLSRKELGPIEVGLLGTKANIWSSAQNKFEAPPRGLGVQKSWIFGCSNLTHSTKAPLRAGSHCRSQVPSHLRSIRAISAVESMEGGSLPLHMGPKSQVPSHLRLIRAILAIESMERSIRAISAVESMDVGFYHFTWVPSPKSQVTQGQSMQSQPLRAWKLGFTTSTWVPSLESQVN